MDVKVVGSINDDKIVASLRAGQTADVISSFTSGNVGVFCKRGAWVDLARTSKDNVDLNQFPASTRYYTGVQGLPLALPLWPTSTASTTTRSLPRGRSQGAAEDVRAADLVREEADEEGGTARSTSSATSRRSASTRTPRAPISRSSAQVLRQLGQVVAQARTPTGRSALKWQKGLIDWYGHGKLVKWQAGAGDEFSASHAFERGKLPR